MGEKLLCQAPSSPPCLRIALKRGRMVGGKRLHLCPEHDARTVGGGSLSAPIRRPAPQSWMTDETREALSLHRAGLLPEGRPLSGCQPSPVSDAERARAARIDAADDDLACFPVVGEIP